MDETNTTNKNHKLEKFFICVFIASLVAIMATIIVLIPKYNKYEKAQKLITTSLLIGNDKFDEYKGDDKLLAKKMFAYYYCAIDTDGSSMARSLVPLLNNVVDKIDDLIERSDFDEFYYSYDYMRCYSYFDYCIYAHKAIFIVEIIVAVSAIGLFVFCKKKGEEYGREKNN